MADFEKAEASEADDEPCEAANTVSNMNDCALQENVKPEADMSDCALHEEKNKKMKSPGRGGEVKR